MTQITDKVFAEGLPPGNYGEGLIIEVDGKYFLNLIDDNGEVLAGTKPLPPGTWRFLFATKSATEEDARKVVKQLNNGVYHDYAYSHFDPCDEYAPCYLSAGESLASLLRSKNLDDKNNYVLIEKL